MAALSSTSSVLVSSHQRNAPTAPKVSQSQSSTLIHTLFKRKRAGSSFGKAGPQPERGRGTQSQIGWDPARPGLSRPNVYTDPPQVPAARGARHRKFSAPRPG